MNPLLGGINKMTQSGMGNFLGNSPLGNIMQFMNEYKRIKSNPSEIGQFLYQKGKITKDQLNEINKMNGNPSAIGEYLINSGSIPQNQINQLQNDTSQMQQYINNTPK